jgi:uncharacterized protein YecT (DUF1311 family)
MKRYFGLILAMMVAGEAQAGPVMECSIQASSQVEVGNCLAKVEKTVAATIEASLVFAMASAKELDTVTGRKVAVPALTAGQAAWVAYRDQHCEFVGATFGGGSGTGTAIRGCQIELGRARIDALLEFAK